MAVLPPLSGRAARSPAATVTEPLSAEICADVKALVELLAVQSYREMGQSSGDEQVRAARIAELERRLETALVSLPAFPAGTAAQTEHAVALSFARACRLSALYPDTVGNADAIIASLPLPAMRRIRAGHGDPDRQAAVFRRLVSRLPLSEADVAGIEAEIRAARERLGRRRQLVTLLRAELSELSPTPGPEEAHRFFGVFFPDHPLRPGEVDVVATESCLYFCILSNEAFARTDAFLARDEAARKHTLDYLERLRRFNFYNFSHFPAFTSFDAREMDPARLTTLAGAMGMVPADLVALLNTAVFVEERDNLDKFLIHDSWGHYWQADLTRLGSLYDRMATLQTPLSPGEAVRFAGGQTMEEERLGTFLDLVYLRRDGGLLFDETLARRFAAAWIAERFQPLLAPVVAELAADMIEYRPDDQAAAGLPSSSRFAHHPAKVDFAWADLLFFVKSLKRVNDLYRKDAELKAGFVERARLLFRLKYRRNFGAVSSPETFGRELTTIFERLLTIFDEVEEEQLGTGLEFAVGADGQPKVNLFFQTLLNLLRVCATVNGLVHGQLENRPELMAHYRTLVIFIVKLFERDPLRHFWSLDETLQAHAVPLLETLAACEREVSSGGTPPRFESRK